MSPLRALLPLAFLLAAGLATAQDADIGRGNMNFDAKAMDTNHDGMISREELNAYVDAMFDKMLPSGSLTIPVQQAAADFTRGNLKFDSKKVDANADGQITKQEFMEYGEAKFDSMKKDPKNQISVADAARNFGRGNKQVDKPAIK